MRPVAKNHNPIDQLVIWGCRVFHLTKHQKLLIQIARFAVVGVLCTAIDWLIYFVLVQFVKLNPLIAQLFSFLVSTIVGYFANTAWVFETTKRKTRRRLITEFFILNTIGLGITELLLWLLIDRLGINYMLAKVIATVITMIFNYLTRKFTLEDHPVKVTKTQDSREG